MSFEEVLVISTNLMVTTVCFPIINWIFGETVGFKAVVWCYWESAMLSTPKSMKMFKIYPWSCFGVRWNTTNFTINWTKKLQLNSTQKLERVGFFKNEKRQYVSSRRLVFDTKWIILVVPKGTILGPVFSKSCLCWDISERWTLLQKLGMIQHALVAVITFLLIVRKSHNPVSSNGAQTTVSLWIMANEESYLFHLAPILPVFKVSIRTNTSCFCG